MDNSATEQRLYRNLSGFAGSWAMRISAKYLLICRRCGRMAANPLSATTAAAQDSKCAGLVDGRA